MVNETTDIRDRKNNVLRGYGSIAIEKPAIADCY